MRQREEGTPNRETLEGGTILYQNGEINLNFEKQKRHRNYNIYMRVS